MTSFQICFSQEQNYYKNVSGSIQERTLKSTLNNWEYTSNPTSLGVNPMPDYGITYFGGIYLAGDDHRAQQEGSKSGINFYSDSYKGLKHLNLWGAFKYSQSRLKDKAFSDIIDPYNGNPYYAGSALKGEYEEQLIELKAKMSSKKLFNFAYAGIGVEYQVGDYSRLRDPRSRSLLANYSINPGFAFQLSPCSKVGITGSYRFSKEKMEKPVTISNQSDKYDYYDMKGNGEYNIVRILDYERDRISNILGSEIQYELSKNNFNFLLSAGIDSREDKVEQASQKSPGDYNSVTYSAGIYANIIYNKGVHNFNLKINDVNGWSNEYLQEPGVYTNPNGAIISIWETIFSAVKYRNFATNALAGWTYYHLDTPGEYDWYAGLSYSYDKSECRYILPYSSIGIEKSTIKARGGYVLLNKNRNSVHLSGSFGYQTKGNNHLVLNELLEAAQKTVIQDNVLIPDYNYFNHDRVFYGADIKYKFPLQRSKNSLSGYISVYGNNYNIIKGSNRALVGFAFGILTF
ncbi:MAG: hypothetical protein PHP30_03395 [Bacteroidales bacterium]|nr:hypothetical protein [Bacteroidales bacterium]MDD3989124.1 hypothetical protein [Bacteroidales bacterium]